MQGNYLRKRSNEQRFAGEEFCEVITALTNDLTKARNELVRLTHKLKPGGDRLYGGYGGPQGPLRPHRPCSGSNARSCNHTPPSGRCGCGKENPHRKRPSSQPQKPCGPTIVPGAKQFGQPQHRAPSCKQRDKRTQQRLSHSSERPQQRVSYSSERPQEKEQPQKCNRNDMGDMSGSSDMTDTSDVSNMAGASDVSGQSDSPCINITFDSPEPAPILCQRCRCNIGTSRGSEPVCLKGSNDLPRLQGGNDLYRLQGRGRRPDMGTQFAAQLKDITFQLQERRLGANPLRKSCSGALQPCRLSSV